MGGLIGGRTPEEIKGMIEMCQMAVVCGECPYETENSYCDQNVVLKYAEELIKAVEAERDAVKKALDEAMGLNAHQARIIKNLQGTNDTRDVHARWIPGDGEDTDATECYNWECSNCHNEVEYIDPQRFEHLDAYCGKCGAKMDEKDQKA